MDDDILEGDETIAVFFGYLPETDILTIQGADRLSIIIEDNEGDCSKL